MAVNYAPGGSIAVALLEFSGYAGSKTDRVVALLRNSANFGGQAPCEFGTASGFVVKYDHDDEKLRGVPAGSRAAEVLRHGMAVMSRGGISPAGFIFSLAAMTGFDSVVNPAAEMAACGITVPPGQNFTVIHVVMPWGPAVRDFFMRFHRHVNTHGPVIAGSPYPSKNHAAPFKFAPAGGAQTEELLAAGGMLAPGNNTLTSYDTGSGVFEAAMETNTMAAWMALRAAGAV